MIIFACLLLLSLAVMLFLVKRQVARMGSLPLYYLDGVEPAWKDIHYLVKGSFYRLWMNNAHKVEFFVVVLGKFVIMFLTKIENVILQFLNFIWGKCKIEKNNSSHYWQMMIRHKNNLSVRDSAGDKIEKDTE